MLRFVVAAFLLPFPHAVSHHDVSRDAICNCQTDPSTMRLEVFSSVIVSLRAVLPSRCIRLTDVGVVALANGCHSLELLRRGAEVFCFSDLRFHLKLDTPSRQSGDVQNSRPLRALTHWSLSDELPPSVPPSLPLAAFTGSRASLTRQSLRWPLTAPPPCTH